MQFSKGRVQQSQSSMTDLSNPNSSARTAPSIQKNLFNFNVYFSDRNQSQVAQSALFENGGIQKVSDLQMPNINQGHLHSGGNNTISYNHHYHRQLKQQGKEEEKGGVKVLMQHSSNKFKPLTAPTTFPKQLNGSQSSANYQLQSQSIGFPSINSINHPQRRSVTRLRLVGYSGDPEFQLIKDTSYKIVKANDGMLVLNMNEIDNEIDYDQYLKQLKRSSSAFLPAYQAFKNNFSGNSFTSNTVNTLNSFGFNNNSSQLFQGAQTLNNIGTIPNAPAVKRPYYFLTDKNEPIFSLKELQDRFPMKYQAQQIIESHEEQQNLQKLQMSRSPFSVPSTSDLNQTPQSMILNSIEPGRYGQNGNGQSNYGASSYQSISTLSTFSQTAARGQNQKYANDDMSDKKIVYLTIRTSQKYYQRDSISQIFTFNEGIQYKQQSQSNIQLNQNVSNENVNLQNTQQEWSQSSSSLYNNGESFKVAIELYTKIAPKACENFIKLCEGFINNDGNYLTFRNTQALRVKKNGFIQMGYSKPGVSIYNGYFEDESFAIQHDKPGILGYCNRGVPHSNSSQFYITLGEMKSFDKKMVAFGRVISGFSHLEKINKMMQDLNTEIPPYNINICDSGVVQNRPSTNQSRKSTSTNLSGNKTPKGRNDPQKFSDSDHIAEDDSYRVVRPDIFSYKGEKPSKFQTYEQYVIGEAEKHKDVAAAEYISLMLAIQSIAFACQEILKYSYTYNTIESVRAAMKQAFISNLSDCQAVALLYDTKDNEVFIESHYGKFVVAFTSLDVDNMYDLNTCGSLFVIYRKTTTTFRPAKKTDLLQSGEAIYGAGYIMYGQSTQIVFHTGYRLNGYTYDSENNLFVLTHPRIKASKKGGIISCDESILHLSDENIAKFIKRKKISKESYVTRYVGSRVADFHRTLLYGGVLIFPQKKVNIFEAFTLSYIIDKAWDRSSCGQDGQILIKKPNDLTDQVQLYIGYSQDVLEIDNLYLSIRRKDSLYKEIPSSRAIKSSSYSIHKSPSKTPQQKQQQ